MALIKHEIINHTIICGINYRNIQIISKLKYVNFTQIPPPRRNDREKNLLVHLPQIYVQY